MLAIDYGPDGERWRSVLRQDGVVKRTILYAGDVEQVTEGGTTRTFYYLGHGIIVVKQGSTTTPYVAITDHLGSITRLVNASGTTVFSASYDAWGKQSVGTTTVKLHRGYTGHEMLSEYGLINMNGRLYDPQLGRFLSPDNYVQQPDNSQNFNRYSYCLNNPLKYNDPSGEFWHIVIGALVGGVTNLVANWHNIDGFWQGFAAFAAGAGSGAAVAATGGTATASAWTVVGVSAASGAVTSATNSIIAQTGKNFEGIGNVRWGSVARDALVGAASGAASGAAGYAVRDISVSIQGINIKSPLLKSVVASPIASAAGHVAGGTVNGLLEGHSLGTSFVSSFRGIGTDMAIGTAIGVASTLGVCYAENINPLTGKQNYPAIKHDIKDPIHHFNLEESVSRIENGDILTQYCRDGTVYRNDEGLLPKTNGEYKEWVVPTPNIPSHRSGPQRIVSSGNHWYYTPDHYGTFYRIK